MRNRPLILSVSPRDLTKPFQGNTRAILSCLGALALNGYEGVHLYVTPKEPRVPYRIDVITDSNEVGSIEIIEVPERKILYADKLIRKPEIIICERRPLFPFCFRLSKYFKVPLILRIDVLTSLWAWERTKYTKNIIPLLKSPFGIASYILMLRLSDYGICVAKELEKRLRIFGIKNITTIEPTHLTILEKNEQKHGGLETIKALEGGNYVIMSISIRAYRIIKVIATKIPDLQYVIIGTPPSHKVIKKMPSNIIWTGNISDQQLIQLYDKASCIMIYRPWLSGISMTLLEALHFGKPCIVNSGAIANLGLEYPNLGGVITNDNISSWPEIALEIQNNKLLKAELEVSAKKFFKQRFSWEVHARKMKSLFDILLTK